MLSSSGLCHNNNSTRILSSSKSSSTYSPISPSSLIAIPHPNKKSIEDVWNDIDLASHHRTATTTATTTHHPSFPGTIFQDFLAQPLKRDPPTTRDASTEYSSAEDATFLGSPATVLSLNSSSTNPQPQFDNHGNGISPSFLDGFASSPPLFPSICNKRALEKDDNDRRHKRMMKNRESATRSRARKQAYTTELELKIAHLKEENAMLKRHLEKFCWADNDQLPKKQRLIRTLTAPF